VAVSQSFSSVTRMLEARKSQATLTMLID